MPFWDDQGMTGRYRVTVPQPRGLVGLEDDPVLGWMTEWAPVAHRLGAGIVEWQGCAGKENRRGLDCNSTSRNLLTSNTRQPEHVALFDSQRLRFPWGEDRDTARQVGRT